MFDPIRPKPIIPSCMAASFCLKHQDMYGNGQTGPQLRVPATINEVVIWRGGVGDAPLQGTDISTMASQRPKRQTKTPTQTMPNPSQVETPGPA